MKFAKVRVFHKSGIPAGVCPVVDETDTKITVLVNGTKKIFSKKTKNQLGTPKLTFMYREL